MNEKVVLTMYIESGYGIMIEGVEEDMKATKVAVLPMQQKLVVNTYAN